MELSMRYSVRIILASSQMSLANKRACICPLNQTVMFEGIRLTENTNLKLMHGHGQKEARQTLVDMAIEVMAVVLASLS